ncbi:MAG: sensor histidine kinase [Bacillota bacterium]
MKLKKVFNTRSLFGKLMLTQLIIIFISLIVISIMFSQLIQNYYYGLKEFEATNNGRRIAELVSETISNGNLESNNISETTDKIHTIARSSNMHIGLMNNEGEMVVNEPTVENFNLTLEDNEINRLLEGNTFTKKMMGPDHRNLLMGIPLLKNSSDEIVIMEPQRMNDDTELLGAIIIQTPLGSIATTVNNILRYILYSFLVAILAAIILSFSFTKKITRPLENIQQSALQGADGNFQEVEIPENGSEEIKHLVNTYNYAVNQINETLQKKQRLEKMRKEFVANVSHEFRAPLTSIKGFLELILEHDLSKEDIKNYTEIMYKDTKYLEHLLSDLLTLGKLETQNIPLDKEKLNPKDLVSRAIKSMQNRFKQKKIQVETNIEENLPDIEVDKHRIHQVLINLLDNAVTYSPEKSNIKISVSKLSDITSSYNSNSNKNRVKITISDEGKGIPEKEQKNIWQRFYKIDRARTRKDINGSGLGLAIVKDIINKHQGEVTVDSTPGEGTTFEIIL